jgi:ribose-phosphate pyrophosphokinase
MKADLITKAGANRILTMDLHAGQIQGFFDIPVDHLYAKPVLINVLKNQYNEEIKEGSLLLVAPDSGATTMTRSYAKRVGNVPIAIIDKRRETPNISEVVNIVSSVPIENKTILMIDDLVDTGGTLIGAAEALIKVGAKKIDAQATHPVLSENAIQDIKDSSISNLFVTDTIPISLLKMIDKIKIISVAPLFAEAIKEIHNNGSVSKLFLD